MGVFWGYFRGVSERSDTPNASHGDSGPKFQATRARLQAGRRGGLVPVRPAERVKVVADEVPLRGQGEVALVRRLPRARDSCSARQAHSRKGVASRGQGSNEIQGGSDLAGGSHLLRGRKALA